MKIKKISQKDNNKYTIHLDDIKLVIYDDIIIKYNLINTREINDETYSKIISDNNKLLYYYKIINYISYKERNAQEIKTKLYSLHASKEVISYVIDRLQKEDYLNEKRYLKAFIHDSVNLSLKGPKKIELELSKLGYSKGNIQNELNNIFEEEWEEKIKKIISKKIKANHNKSKRILILNIKKDLINDGYSEEMFSKFVNNINYDDSIIREKEYEKLKRKYQNKYQDEELEKVIQRKLYEKGF